ncbi:MAG: UDP-3-O-[3-hydroxymyristoyl] N-acetylglucosamine deacetylase [Bacteroidetes bacterium]|nr:UDP-3-O-[3-hydroxymyristoyl] N-acetylglucosamine deacetylase [Bacteroidota bacterium]
MYSEQPLQTTVSDIIEFDGIGLHSGRFVRVSIFPAPANTGIKFQRIDVTERRQTIAAHPDNVQQARLCTRIVNEDGVRLETVEHIMAAFAGLGIDNAVVKIDSGEAPILDGSSLPVVQALNRVGITTMAARRRTIVVTTPIHVNHADGWARLEPSDQLEIDAEIDFEDAAIGRQRFHYVHGDGQFERELAAARTFCQMRDVAAMQNAGLALGGSLSNAIVVENGAILNEGGLRLPNEFVRHKILDCLGDLYLLGMPLRAKVTASRPGHAMCARLIQTLWHSPDCYHIVEDGTFSRHSDGYAMPEVAAAAAV